MTLAAFSAPGTRVFSVDTEEGRAYLQHRIAAFTKILFFVSLALVVFVTASRSLADLPLSDTQRMVALGLAGLVLMILGGMWRTASGKLKNERFVRMLDFACTVDPSVLLGVMLFTMRDVPTAPLGSLLILIFIILGRALIIPSSAQHTFAVSCAAALPVVVSHGALAFFYPAKLVLMGGPLVMLLGSIFWAAVAVGMATYGSKVIYGLREEVRAARQLGPYTLVEKIGEGGMGIVFRAEHALLSRPTAVKLIPQEKAGEAALSRFEREVQTTAQLAHPNTVQIYDYGRTPDGVFYYAMEYLDGIDLEQLVEAFGPQPPGRVARIAAQACAALVEAHGRGLVHRDIKPANIFLCHRGGMPDVVKVIDFGLVKDLAPQDGTALTRRDVLSGTPAYLSPEAIQAPDQVGPSADIYAIGATLYFLLSGEQVFSGATVVEVCSHHLHTAPPPLEQVATDVSASFEALVMSCLGKVPAARPTDARALRRALMALPEYDGWTETDADQWWRRHAPS